MPGRALFSSLGLAIGRMFRFEEIMAAVALQSVEYVHGLQLDSVQLKQFKHKQDEPAKELQCCSATRKVVRLGSVLELGAAEYMRNTVNMKALLWLMFSTMFKMFSSYHTNLEKDLVVSLHCLVKKRVHYQVTTGVCYLGDSQPCCHGIVMPLLAASGLLSLVASGLFSIAALGLMSQATLVGLFSLTASGVFSFATELGCPEEGFMSLVAQKDLIAWLPCEGTSSIVTQKKRMFQLGCPEEDLRARLPSREMISLAPLEDD